MKKILAIALSFAMLLSLLSVAVVAEAPAATAVAPAAKAQSQPVMRYGRSVLAQQPNAAHVLCVYDRIVESLSTNLVPTPINTTYNGARMSFDDAFEIYQFVLADYPEFFFVGLTLSGSGDTIIPEYWSTGAERQADQAVLMARVAELTAGLEGKSDYIKSLTIHDRLVQAVTYDMVGHHQTAYGALVDGYAVCAGYARAYQLLMNHVGIPVWYISGNADNGLQYGGHAWSLVQLDGNWYYTDVTWDDTDYDGWMYYEHLNVTYDYIRTDHFEDEMYAGLLPVANSIDCGYGVCNSIMMERFDLERVRAILRENPNARFYVTGDAEAFRAELRNRLNELTGEYNWTSYSTGGSGSLVTIRLEVQHTCTYQKVTVPATCTNPSYTVKRCTHPYCAKEKNRTEGTGNPVSGAHVYFDDQDMLCDECAQRRAPHTHTYDNACDPTCNDCGEQREVPGHVYRSEFDTACDACGALRSAPVGTLFVGNSVSEDVAGLAFAYKADVAGIALQNKYRADYSNATLGGYKLLEMGAILSNGFDEITIPAVYLLDVDSRAETATFAVRATYIPSAFWDAVITATPYYTVEIDGVVTTVYGDVQSASYNGVLAQK